MSITIRTNSKSLSKIFKNAIDIQSYTLENCFSGESVKDINFISGITQGNGKLTHDEKGNYTLDFHSNRWYTFKSISIRRKLNVK